ncbi:MAG: hypothetical protein ACTS5A_03030 [Candidatus Hodgkinia cicadicola]
MKLCKCAPHSPLSPSFVNSKVGGGAFDEFPAPPTFQTKDEGGAHLPPKGVRKFFTSGVRDRNVRTMRKRNCSVGPSSNIEGRFRLCGGKWERRSVVCARETAAWRST